MWSKLNLI
jgi:hypothetical protein